MYHDTRVHLYPSHGAIHFMLVGGPTKKTKPLSQQSKPWSVYCSHFIHFSILVERKGTHSKSWSRAVYSEYLFPATRDCFLVVLFEQLVKILEYMVGQQK